MVGAAAEAARAAAASSHQRRHEQNIAMLASARCFCRRTNGDQVGLGLGLGTGLVETTAGLGGGGTFYAAWILFAASVALAITNAVQVRSPFPFKRWNHSRNNHTRRAFYGPRNYYYHKKLRRPRWEWRPVTRRSAASQTMSTGSSCSVAVGSEIITSTIPEEDPVEVNHGMSVSTIADDNVLNILEFPSLSDVVTGRDQATITTGLDQKKLVASGSESSSSTLSRTAGIHPDVSRPTFSSVSSLSTTSDIPEINEPPLNRKQRKYLKRKQKRLFAESHVLRINSLPILKPWRSSTSSASKSSATKTFGPLTMNYFKRNTREMELIFQDRRQPSEAGSSTGSMVLLPQEKAGSTQETISETEDWMEENNGSSGRSQSDPEEIDIGVAYTDSEFEADSEDYSSFQT